jgi:hypothetical protein
VYPVVGKRSMMGAFARDACGQPLRATGEGQGQAGCAEGIGGPFAGRKIPFLWISVCGHGLGWGLEIVLRYKVLCVPFSSPLAR